MEVSNNIRKRRRELELSQYQVEFLTGISQAKLSLVERGLRKLRPDERQNICKALHLEEEELFPFADKN